MKLVCVVKSPACDSGQQCSPGKSIEQGQHIATLALYALPASSKFWLKNSLYNTVAELSSSFCFFFPGLYLSDYFWNSYQLPASIKSWEKVLQSLTVHYTKELFLHFEPVLKCAVLWFQHSHSGLSSKLRCRKSYSQTQQWYVASSSVRDTHRRWCYFHTTPPGLSRTKRLLVFWSTLMTGSGFLFLWMDGRDGKPSRHKECPDYQKGIWREWFSFLLPLNHSHVSFHQLKALKWHRRLFRAILWQCSWVQSMSSNLRSS